MRSARVAAPSAPGQSPISSSKDRIWKMRDIITLQCMECKERNYSGTKNKKKHTERLETKKYCPRCRQHTVHRETK